MAARSVGVQKLTAVAALTATAHANFNAEVDTGIWVGLNYPVVIAGTTATANISTSGQAPLDVAASFWARVGDATTNRIVVVVPIDRRLAVITPASDFM